MTRRGGRILERWVDYGAGRLAVYDHGGEGTPVLFVHSLGPCAMTWNYVVPHLGAGVHAYALDLPGHGHSTVDPTDASDGWRAVEAVARGLDLDRPLLVAHHLAEHMATVAVRDNPDLFRGLVVLGGEFLLDTEKSREDIALALDPGMGEALRTRFRLGYTGTDPDSARELVDALVNDSDNDWLLGEMRRGLRAEVEHSVHIEPDGSWLHKPTLESVLAYFRLPEDSPLLPSPSFYEGLSVPLRMVHLRDGYESVSPQEAAIVAGHPMLHLAYLDSTAWPQYDKPQETAELILAVLADPDRDDLPTTPEQAAALARE